MLSAKHMGTMNAVEAVIIEIGKTEVGQRYRIVAAGRVPSHLWEVTRVYMPWYGGLEHACLKSIAGLSETMTLATSVGADKKRFERDTGLPSGRLASCAMALLAYPIAASSCREADDRLQSAHRNRTARGDVSTGRKGPWGRGQRPSDGHQRN
jgi:hypothetical protein